jgi:hypothetical protein
LLSHYLSCSILLLFLAFLFKTRMYVTLEKKKKQNEKNLDCCWDWTPEFIMMCEYLTHYATTASCTNARHSWFLTKMMREGGKTKTSNQRFVRRLSCSLFK